MCKPPRYSLFAILLFLSMTAQAPAYLDAPAEKLTLPELIKEFKSIEVMKASRVDLDRGVVIWERAEQIQGKANADHVRHLIHLHGETPPALSGLKVDYSSLFFSQDGFKRGLLLTEGCWYVADFEADHDCWRIAFTDRHYDFNTCFAGKPEDAATAVKKLLNGEEVIVACHVRPGHPDLQNVRYTLKHPHEKISVSPATAPSG